MENDQAAFFDEHMAQVYDRASPDPAATVAFLEQLARGGPALELAIGTGRIALPLAARGIRVDGIDISPAMVAQLRAKPGGDQLAVTIGDFAEVAVEGAYRLIFVVFNTLFNLGSRDRQLRCFENVAAHLTDDGVFVVEAMVPKPSSFDNGQYVDAEAVGLDTVQLDVCRDDPGAQRMDECHVVLFAGGARLFPVVARYVWPSELDLMAELAGLRLKERWAGWKREPFDSTSTNHLSVYGR